MCDRFGHVCNSSVQHSSLIQSIDEVDFERGIWGAVMNNDRKKVESIIEKGFDIDTPDKYGYTANNRYDICYILLKHGANVLVKTNSDGASPAHRAAYAGNLGILKLLFENTGSKLAQLLDSTGQNCLHSAYRGRKQDVIDWLSVTFPEMINHLDRNGKTPREC